MRIIIWNQGAERIFGYKEKEILGKPIVLLTSKKNKQKAGGMLTKLFEPNRRSDLNGTVEVELIRKNGTIVPVEISVSKRKVEESYLVTGIVRDITERKEAEEKLRKIDQMKSEFLSNVSHELRTPLQSIGGFAKLILEGKVPDVETQQEFLQIIDRESQQLGILINSLLDMSRLESGLFQINKRFLPLRDTFIDSIKIFHSIARDKDVLLDEDIPERLPEVEVDAERLRQVIVNLMSNAIKFSDPGGSVMAKLEMCKGELLFQVKDRGIGMDKKAMSHLFERFYRAEDKLARGGTGLGLFISKQIIEAHGGRIWAESKIGEGSTFSFTLPLNGKGGNGNGKKDTNNRR
jgi:PAS domain S-box-containing protein